ncbi:MAG: hypothetical protein JEZ02_21675 [Desulfatibacillum sp.]|nr:hypothetical protein [Desulfatibacillum sp.]
MTEASIQALSLVRNPENMKWYVVPLIVIAIYMYIVDAEQKNWSAILLGLAFWAGEFVWEMFNALVLHFSGFAAMWSTPGGDSAYVIYAGLNIEIAFFFSVVGLMIVKALPEDKKLKILGVSNRILIPVGFGLLAVFVEVCLNQCNLLVWDYGWWRWPNIGLIVVVYCAPFYLIARLHDALSLRAKKIALAVTTSLAVVCHVLFATILGWV